MYLPTAEKSGALLLPFWHFLPKCWEQNHCSLWAVTQHTVTLCARSLTSHDLFKDYIQTTPYTLFEASAIQMYIPSFQILNLLWKYRMREEHNQMQLLTHFIQLVTFYATEYMRATCMTWTLSFGHFCFCFQCPIIYSRKIYSRSPWAMHTVLVLLFYVFIKM